MEKYLNLTGLSYFWDKIKSYAVKRITSTDNAVVRFDGTNGNVQNSDITIDDNNVITTPGDVILKNSSNGAATPKIEFRRGSNSDSYNDWIISSDSSGRFIISLKATSSSNKVILTSSGIVFANSLEASSIKKTNGTSSLFLKADGTVDSNVYVPFDENGNILIPLGEIYADYIEGASLYSTSGIHAEGDIDAEADITAGGSATIAGDVTISGGNLSVLSGDIINNTGNIEAGYLFSNGAIENNNFTVDTDGNVITVGTLTAGGLNIDGGDITVDLGGTVIASAFQIDNGTSSQFLKADGSVDNTSYFPLTGGTITGDLGVNGDIALAGNIELNNATLYENGNISTFGGFIKSGGTSSLFLKADGSVDSNSYAGSQSAGGPANKTVSIPFGQVDSNSTATAFTATIDGITELRDGVCVYLRNGVIDSDSGYTININNLGAKPVYNAFKGTATSGMFSSDSTFLFVYNSSRISGGCWDAVTGYYETDTNTIGYYIRTNSQTLPVSDRTAKYRILFTSADGTKYVPANSTSNTNATSKRDTCQTPINPFGNICIYYNSSTTSISAGTIPSASILWQQRNISLGYSFNWEGGALTLTDNAPVYVKCTPQSDGSAIIVENQYYPIVQELPTTDDGKIYIFLGNATSATTIELMLNHPVYYYKNGAIRLWTGPV